MLETKKVATFKLRNLNDFDLNFTNITQYDKFYKQFTNSCKFNKKTIFNRALTNYFMKKFYFFIKFDDYNRIFESIDLLNNYNFVIDK